MALSRRAFVKTLFVASQTALLGRLGTGTVYAEQAPASGLNFAVIGDWGRRGRPDQAQVAQQMAAACKNASASFVISVGDNFYLDGVASLEDTHWRQSFEDVYNAPSLQVPWYVILGNHDYHGNTEAQLEYGKTHPRWNMPARYFTDTHPLDDYAMADFFYIDTSPFISEYFHMPTMQSVLKEDTAAQLKWLDRALTKSIAPWKIVYGHHPIYSAGAGHGDQQDLIERLLPILQKHRVPVYFAGHDHDLQHLKAGDLDMFVSGGGSEHLPINSSPHASFAKATSGFAMCSLDSRRLKVDLIDNTGAVLYSTIVQRPA